MSQIVQGILNLIQILPRFSIYIILHRVEESNFVIAQKYLTLDLIFINNFQIKLENI
jgi:hypothetical protein